MILTTLASTSGYAVLHPLFPHVFEYMRNTDLRKLEPGNHTILDEQIFVIAESATGCARDEAKLECHRNYIDIHLVLAGTEEIGWKSLYDCREPIGEYSAEKDIQFFHDTPINWIASPPGHLCIFFPDDAHAPLVSDGLIRKAIFKIAVKPALP